MGPAGFLRHGLNLLSIIENQLGPCLQEAEVTSLGSSSNTPILDVVSSTALVDRPI
jgi:hypothetical protein